MRSLAGFALVCPRLSINMSGFEMIDSAESSASVPVKENSLFTESVPIDAHCDGDRWLVKNQTRLARIIAIVALGQASHAAHIIRELLPTSPAFHDDDLFREAKIKLTRQDVPSKPRIGYPQWQRDGFVFEVISWVAARQENGSRSLLRDPHISSTAQGLDGLMIELSDDRSTVKKTTIFEDKCTDNPRETFVQKVMPAFVERHGKARGAELVATASALIRMAGVDESVAAQVAAGVLDLNLRRYRAAFALTQSSDSQAERQKLFKGYDGLNGLSAQQRIGAGLIVNGNLREWFDEIAAEAVSYLNELGGSSNV